MCVHAHGRSLTGSCADGAGAASSVELLSAVGAADKTQPQVSACHDTVGVLPTLLMHA